MHEALGSIPAPKKKRQKKKMKVGFGVKQSITDLLPDKMLSFTNGVGYVNLS
jgi:hypothetical protein